MILVISKLKNCFNFYVFLIIRLKDCLDLLESMDRKGLLDMEKVSILSAVYLFVLCSRFFLCRLLISTIFPGSSEKLFECLQESKGCKRSNPVWQID